MRNITISHGDVGDGAGGIANQGSVSIMNATIVENFGKTQISGNVNEIRNSIIFRAAGNNCAVAIGSTGNNVENGDSCHLNSPTDRINLDPRLGALGNYGGPTDTYPLLTESPATFARDWLAHKGLQWAADALNDKLPLEEVLV